MNTLNENTNTETTTSASFPAMIEIKKKAPDFTALAYAGAAVSKDETRYVITNVCIHKGHAIGTDGRRLNRAKLSSCFPYSEEMILYRVMKLNKTSLIFAKVDEAMNYPNYEQVIPKLEKKLGEFTCGDDNASGAFCRILNAADGTGFNFEYFEKSAPDGLFEAYQESKIAPLCMVTREKGAIAFTGVVMPIRLEAN